jgi:hypothetical protein
VSSSTANLNIQVSMNGAAQAQTGLQNLQNQSSRTERASAALTATFLRMTGGLGLLASAVAGVSKLVEVQRQFDKINAGLITATGSTEKATQAFEALQEFAATTPYDLAQVSTAFTQLVNFGLRPSEAALRSYGNTAAASGKDLSQLVEAVADAATGEFERLKEFGIKTKNLGDTLSFSFRGNTTVIKNSSEEIQKYIQALGDNEFAGAMAERAKTLDGAISNLGDSWNQLFLNISKNAAGDTIADGVRTATAALDELNLYVKSGEFTNDLVALGSKFDGFFKDAESSLKIFKDSFSDEMGLVGDIGAGVADLLTKAFTEFPENARAAVKLLTVEYAALGDRVDSVLVAMKDILTTPIKDLDIGGIGDRFLAEQENISKARQDSIIDIISERDAALEASKAKFEANKKEREQFEADRAAKKAASGGKDRLAEFEKGGGSSNDVSAETTKRRQKEFEQLQASLRTEEETIAESYRKRNQIILENTAAGSDKQNQLMAALESQTAAQYERIRENKEREIEDVKADLFTEEEEIYASYDRRIQAIQKLNAVTDELRNELADKALSQRDKELRRLDQEQQDEFDRLSSKTQTELEQIQLAYEQKRQLILDNERITEEQRQELLSQLNEKFQKDQAEAQSALIQSQLSNASDLFGSLSQLAKGYAGEQSKTYKTLFAVSKAFAIAQAGVSIATGVAKAQELGFPANLGEMARIAAAAVGIYSSINGANFAGAFDKGGFIPSGQIGLVGEFGPELIKGPANVTSRKETADAFKGRGSDAPVVNVAPPVNKIINVLDPALVGQYLTTDDGERMVVNIMQRNQRSLG